MRAAGTLVVFCLLTMASALTWGIVTADFRAEGAILMDLTWGVISVIDVYTGAALFVGWIAFRERSVPRVAAWALGIFVLGNFATSLYALLALAGARGDISQFWLGKRVETRT